MFAQSGGRHGRTALSPRATGVATAGPLCGCEAKGAKSATAQ